ncbi:uncharacterized protein LOC126988361 [Eriocheir sinensis]|uniref:uncharacterized protein LOC126988361 n=1 Tax=Eriocheir sinensis TaxID=95602 RepID=UPI0021CAA9CD|nr:uncharacterized protein LOC126988361 [Eriocheir sinensis]
MVCCGGPSHRCCTVPGQGDRVVTTLARGRRHCSLWCSLLAAALCRGKVTELSPLWLGADGTVHCGAACWLLHCAGARRQSCHHSGSGQTALFTVVQLVGASLSSQPQHGASPLQVVLMTGSPSLRSHTAAQHGTSEVGLHVLGNVPLHLEVLPTHVTLELSQARVSEGVTLQGLLLSEPFSSFQTLMRPFTSVCVSVYLEMALPDECVTTNLTLMRPFTSVCVSVYLEMALPDECVTTNLTLMRPFASVCKGVCVEVTLPTEPFATLLAFMRSFTSVCKGVSFEVTLATEPFAPFLAFMGSFSRVCGCIC